jgi:hypothetical protein
MSSEAPQGIKISAYLFFAAAVLWLIIFCGLLGFLGLSAADTGGEAGPLIGFGFAACFSLLAVVLYGAVGYGLLGLQSWSRLAAIILAIVALCNFPLGTIIGAIVLYFMFQEETKQAFP